jgi:hypothetical protein
VRSSRLGLQAGSSAIHSVLKDDALWCNCESLYPAAACSGAIHFEEGEIMSCHASIRGPFPDPSIATEDTREMSRAREWRPDSTLPHTKSKTEIETQLLIDRLLSECFAPKSRQA